MPQIHSFEGRLACFGNLRKRILWMFIGISRQGTQGFEFTNGGQPQSDLRAAAPAPCFDRKGELCTPQKKERKEQEELVQTPVQTIRHPAQSSDLPRCRLAAGFEIRSQLSKLRRGELFLFQTRKNP